MQSLSKGKKKQQRGMLKSRKNVKFYKKGNITVQYLAHQKVYRDMIMQILSNT